MVIVESPKQWVVSKQGWWLRCDSIITTLFKALSVHTHCHVDMHRHTKVKLAKQQQKKARKKKKQERGEKERERNLPLLGQFLAS